MKRRATIVPFVLILALLTAASALSARPLKTVARVVMVDDYLSGPPLPELHAAFREGLRDLGWVEGHSVVVETRYAERPEQRLEIAADMARTKVDVVVVCSPCAFWAAPHGAAPINGIPIVFPMVSDPVAARMVASIARPGGKMTGQSYLGIDLNVKRLELLREAFPEISRVGVLAGKHHPLKDRMIRELDAAAPALKLALELAEISNTDPTAIDAGIDELAHRRSDALLVLQSPFFWRERVRLAAAASRHRLPTMFDLSTYVESGGLMSYGADLAALHRGAAKYVDRILRGANPGDLPVEQPTKVTLMINLRVARALGLSPKPSVLLRADRLID